MKILALSDTHGYAEQIDRLVDVAPACDVILLAGDITDFGGRRQALSIFSAFDRFHCPVLGVTGNCDLPEVDEVFAQRGGNLVKTPVNAAETLFLGFPFRASDADVLNADEIIQSLGTKRMVLVSHEPAWGTDVDLQASSRHKGSHVIRSFIEDYQPVLAISGHIHEACGVDQIGSTVLVNPGPLRDGRYAVIDIDGGDVQVKLHWL